MCRRGAGRAHVTSLLVSVVDELFQKVAEDYNNAAFQFLPGETDRSVGSDADALFARRRPGCFPRWFVPLFARPATSGVVKASSSV